MRYIMCLILLVLAGCSMARKGPEATIIQHNQTDQTFTQPIIRVVPVYPEFAVERHVEGYVNLSYDVTADGEVVNVRILDAKPEHIFNDSAIKALSRWKYSIYPKGKQVVARQDQTVRFDYAFPAKTK